LFWKSNYEIDSNYKHLILLLEDIELTTNKVLRISIIIFVLGLVGCGVYGYNYLFGVDEKEMKLLEKRVENYLINEKGYKKSDIKELKAVHNAKYVGNPVIENNVKVVFSDEPNATYIYNYSPEENRVFQFDYTNEKGKHLEEGVVNKPSKGN
ncbi:DUF3139 domain-containing protein, partial [Aneurinibacillus aneurinilyticus]